MKRLTTLTLLTFAALPVALLTNTNAIAQDDDAVTEEVVVVGTRGDARSPLDSAVPVDLITAEDIAAAHSFGGELGELLQALAPSFNFPRQSNSGLGDHVRAAQLRGMSPDHVLVLVNGKRQHTASVVALESKIGLGANPFDFNTIPLIAIKRIEILRDGSGAQYGSDAIAGVINIVLKDAAEGGTVSVSYGAHRTDFEPINDTITDGDTFSIAADYGFTIGDGGSLRIGAEYRSRDPTNRAGIGVLPFFEDQTAANLALDPARLFAPGDGGADDIYLYYNAEVPLNELVFYSFGRYSNRDSEGTGFFRYPDGFTSLPSVYPNGFRPITLGDNTDMSFSAGLRGTNFQSDWDLSLTIGRNDFDSGVRDSANPSIGPTSPTSFDLGGFEFLQTTINADVVRDIDVDSFSGPLTFAYGAELRFEDYETSAGDPESYEPGAFIADVGAQAGPGLPAGSVADVDRTVISVYVDLEAEVTDRLRLGAAARYEDYDDFGSAFTGKVSARLQVTDVFAIRGAAGTSFRAPSLAQIGYERSTTNFGSGGMLELFRLLPVSDPVAIQNGAIPLKEEESQNFSAGFIVDLGSDFTLTLDYFQIDVDDRISLINAGNNIQYFSNRVDTETTGFDVVVSGTRDLGSGVFDWSVSYNKSETDVKNPSVIGPEDLNTIETASPEDKFIASGNWSIDRWSFLLRATQFGEAKRVFDFGGGFEPEQTYGSVWSIDAEVAAKVTDQWTVAIGADNLLDEYPDLSSDDINYFGHLPYDVLSPIGMNGAYFYIRAQYDY
ncbi:MAG: TonB-dependent receptor [Proteobacteria bacterium]|nr:TonB-dependent receptor [Pseudomonadota bacterium]